MDVDSFSPMISYINSCYLAVSVLFFANKLEKFFIKRQ